MLTVGCRSSSKEWQLKRKQREGPVKTVYGTLPKLRHIVLRRDNYTCQECGKINGTVHHKVPRKDGGQDSMDNLVTVCNGGCHKKAELLLLIPYIPM